MGTLAKGAAGGIVFGAVFGVASYTMYPRMSETEAEQFTDIEACAQQLPEESTPINGSLPEHCQRYGVYIGSFVTPKPEEFRDVMNERVTTDEQRQDINVKMAAIISLCFGLIGVAVGKDFNAGSQRMPSSANKTV